MIIRIFSARGSKNLARSLTRTIVKNGRRASSSMWIRSVSTETPIFSEVSRHLTGLLEADESHVKRISFALALYIRRIYTYFFDHLL